MSFLQKFWHVIKEEIRELFKELHRTGSFMKSLNSSFLVLIYKVEGEANIMEFLPINFVGYVYKFMMKVLAKTLAKVVDKVIGECHHTFIE